jgi:hypothetical protein
MSSTPPYVISGIEYAVCEPGDTPEVGRYAGHCAFKYFDHWAPASFDVAAREADPMTDARS